MAFRRKEATCRLHLGRSITLGLTSCLLALSLTGCPIGAVIALFAKKSPTITVQPKYELPAGDMLILVDSPVERTGLSGVTALLTSELDREIMDHRLAPKIIPTQDLVSLQISAPNYGQLDIAQIGRRVDAQRVLYVEVVEFTLGTVVDDSDGHGIVRARVKVFDVELNKRVWPKTKPRGHEVIVRTDFREPSGKQYRREFTEDLCQRTAEAIVKLFREHEEPRPAGQ